MARIHRPPEFQGIRLMSLREAARVLGVPRSVIVKYIVAGCLRSVRLGLGRNLVRVLADEVDRLKTESWSR